MNRFISMAEVEATASSVIPEINDEERAYFPQWMYMAMRRIGASKDYMKVSDPIPVSNLIIPKPSDLASTIDIALFNDEDVQFMTRYSNGSKRINNGSYSPSIPKIIISEDNNYFYLDSNGDQVTKAYIRYFSLPMDSCGLLISEQRLMALVYFLRYMVMMRRGATRHDLAASKMDWEMEAKRVRTHDKMPSMLEGKEIATTWMSMIDKVFHNQF